MEQQTKPKNKMGRPKIEINQTVFDTVIQLPLTKADIAGCCAVSEDTIERYVKSRFETTFAVLHEQKKHTFRKNILGKQYEMAMKGDRTLLIWLGKQYLNQADKVETKQDVSLKAEDSFQSAWGSIEATTTIKKD
jgi:hypothetical protein